MSAKVDRIVVLVETLNLSAQEQTELADRIGICPWDCDSCHSDDCPCTRLGCEGSGVHLD